MPHLEFGDKIVLPPKILVDLQCLKIPTPLIFMVRAAGQDNQPEGDLAISSQYCSVQEFSSPDGQVFVPYWLMQNLGVREGGSVVVTSVVSLPRGAYCRLQPETTSFLDLAAEIGPKLLMETALRRYSVLSTGSTIVIEYGSVRYNVRVVELKPAPVVSLCGDVDLETDFMPPEKADPKRPSTAQPTTLSKSTSESSPSMPIIKTTVAPNNAPITLIGHGRRLRDGGYMEICTDKAASSKEKAHRKLPMGSLQRAQQNVRESKTVPTEAVAAMATANDSPELAARLRSAQRAFSTTGYTLGTATTAVGGKSANIDSPISNVVVNQVLHSDSSGSPSVTKCNLCLANVTMINMELHTLRCAKNPAYHKFECSTCQEKILRIHESRHHHCPDCSVLCDNNETLADHQRNEHTASSKCSLCHAFFTRAELQNHLDNRQCAHALMPCSLCGLAFKKLEITQHTHMCSSRTKRCDECKSYVKITDLDTHEQQCAAFARQESTLLKPETSVATTTSSQNAIECVYCLQGNFPDIAAVEYHVLRDCHVAKSFTTEPTRTNQEEADPVSSEDVEEPHSSEIVRPLLAQGRMRRKDDANALRCTASRSLFSSNNNHWNQRNPPPSPTVLPPVRLALQAGKLRKLKPKPRPNPHVRSLSQPAKLAAKSVHTSDRNVNFGSPDLCISSVGGNSQRSRAIPPRPQATTRTRRRPAANLPRLEKLP
ncbi:hypothetical protein F441_20537 [Phytophthora nicotianae CJ01A1]|uniref:TRAF-type domain-containing protein n=1 Tax=Phytophthora nicotianae CJ01A1 TaxID=1317063 RepID=W2VYC0_PHYNI|nr:hypothetical protein F441_20537 [Phytophthora nicotianae CJ01A1]